MSTKSHSKSLKKLPGPVLAILGLAMLVPLCARADAVSDWSLIANTVVIANAGTRPPASMIDFAYVHVAIYDAVNAIDRRYSTFSVAPTSPTGGASPEAATAAAAYTILKAFYPAQSAFLDTT